MAEEVRQGGGAEGARVKVTPRPQESLGARTGRSLGKEGLRLQLRNPGLGGKDNDLGLPAGFRTCQEENE